MTPAQQLRLKLTADRRAGITFTDAYPRRVAAVLATISDSKERQQWAVCFRVQRTIWRDCFNGIGELPAPSFSIDVLTLAEAA